MKCTIKRSITYDLRLINSFLIPNSNIYIILQILTFFNMQKLNFSITATRHMSKTNDLKANLRV